MQEVKWQCRWAPSLGELEDTAEKTWGTVPYSGQPGPAVFFGLYGFPDFYTLWRHDGRKCVLWAGSDIIHFTNGYWLEGDGEIKIDPKSLAKWIEKNCESYVENVTEQTALNQLGIFAKIVPSFLGDKNEYEITYKPAERPKVYLSANPGRELEYGFGIVESIAEFCDVDFHLYGAHWNTNHKNVHIHGRVSKEKMNEDIKSMQCGLRLNEFDGFSEVLAKSVLWGQYPISRIPYPHIDSYTSRKELITLLNELKNKKSPNYAGRNYYLENINKYPWV